MGDSLTAGRAAVLLLFLAAQPAHAQIFRARPIDYLFVTNASDVRATWVNPAGLAVVPEASLYGGITLERTTGTDFRTEQFGFGLNTRGISVAYLRKKFEDGTAAGLIRAGTGFPLRRGSFGVAITQYRVEGDDHRELDIGLMLVPSSIVTIGGVVRHIGRAEIGSQKFPVTLVGGAQINTLGQSLQFQGEAQAAERLGVDVSGYDMSYRGGVALLLPLSTPVQLLAVADLAQNIRIDRLHFGLSVGTRTHVTAIGTGVRQSGGSSRLERLSAAGVASNVLLGQRR